MANGEYKRIMLVEDQVLIAEAEKSRLEKYGYDVLIANNGEKGVKMALENDDIDLILMDIDLGKGIDGTEAARQILKEREYPIVFLSNHVEPEIVKKTEKITSYGYVVKDSGITVLDASIKMAFRLHEAKMELKEREKRFESLFTKNHSVLLLIDPERGQILDANPSACQFYGYTKEQLLDMQMTDINRLSSEEIRNELSAAESADRSHFEFQHVLASGEIREVEVYASPIDIDNKKLVYSIIHDVTEKKKTEATLAAHQERLELIYNSTSSLMALIQEEDHSKFRILSFNNSYWEAIHTLNTEISRDQLLGTSVEKMGDLYDWPPSIVNNTIECYRQALDSGIAIRQVETIPASGGDITLEVSYVPLVNKESRYVLFTAENISERIKTEEELHYLLSILKRTEKMAKTGGWEFDPQTLEGTWTEQTALIHETDPLEPITAAKGLDFYINESRERISKAVEQCIEKGRPYNLELELKTARGN